MNKTKATLLVALTAAAMTIVPQTSFAGHREDKVFAAIGGFIGGVIVGSQVSRDRCPPPPPRCEPEPRVIIVQRDCPPPAPAGYWREESVRVWVPGQWVETRDDCGRRIKVWDDGHYTYRTTRVWVAYDRRDYDDGPYYARR